ncbi:MAG: hypothetical protein RLZZ458_2979 [Planctomycetota bacterium]|jgi:hypothetical protein
MPGPSGRKRAVKKSSLHTGGVWCVLFSMRSGESNGIEVGSRTIAQLRAPQPRHAEPQWWNLNHAECDNELCRDNVLQLEFEVTLEFCSDACRLLFAQARHLAIARGKPRLPIFVFIHRSETYYRISERAEMDGPYPWD